MNENTIVITVLRADFLDFIQNFKKNTECSKKNVIVDLRSVEDLNESDLVSFLEISNYHTKKNKKSLVLVNEQVTYDELPDELNLTPTLQEAYDIVEMEEIQRDLGF